jgi:hypothetical protein
MLMILLERRVPRLFMAVLPLVVLAIAACGGGDDDDAPPTDEDWVRGLCEATATFQTALDDAAAEVDLTDIPPANAGRELADAFEEPVEAYVASLGDLRPPVDLVDYQRTTVDEWRFAREGIRDGRIGALDEVDVPSLPGSAGERIREVAGSLDACNPVMDLFRAPRETNQSQDVIPSETPRETVSPTER